MRSYRPGKEVSNMNVQPTKSFVFRYSEDDLALWSRVLAYILSSDAAAGAFAEQERRVLAVYHRELSRTRETAPDDDDLTPAGEPPASAAGTTAAEPPGRSRPVCQV